MTETVSHIALRPVGSQYFDMLTGVEFGEDQGCLWVKGQVTNNKRVQTNDLIKITSQQSFQWLGRKDNVINSGGIKIYPEQVEIVISEALHNNDISLAFYLGKENDSQLGEKLVMYVEGNVDSKKVYDIIRPKITALHSKHHVPRNIRDGMKFKRTESGKIIR